MIYLREITQKDIILINNRRDSRELNDLFTSPFRYVNYETDLEWFNNYLKDRNKDVRLAICLRSNNEMIGTASLLNIDCITRTADFGGMVIYDKENRGKGYGYKALMLLLKHAFHDKNINRVQSKWLIGNKISINLGKKCGFREEGILRKATYKNGKYHDLLLMSILREEFDEIEKQIQTS